MLLNLQIWENFCSGEECYILQNSCIFYLTRFCILQYIFYLSRLTSQGVRKARDNYQLTCIYEQHDPPYIMTDPNLGRIHLIMEFCYFGENLIWSNSAQQRERIFISHQPHCILTTVCRSQLSVGITMQGCSGGIEGRLVVSTAWRLHQRHRLRGGEGALLCGKVMMTGEGALTTSHYHARQSHSGKIEPAPILPRICLLTHLLESQEPTQEGRGLLLRYNIHTVCDPLLLFRLITYRFISLAFRTLYQPVGLIESGVHTSAISSPADSCH